MIPPFITRSQIAPGPSPHAAPPTTLEHALHVAVEHLAFCPDVVWQCSTSFAEHAEDQKGVLSAGLLADIAVLDRDIVTIPPAELAGLQVTATIVGGRVVYER